MVFHLSQVLQLLQDGVTGSGRSLLPSAVVVDAPYPPSAVAVDAPSLPLSSRPSVSCSYGRPVHPSLLPEGVTTCRRKSLNTLQKALPRG